METGDISVLWEAAAKDGAAWAILAAFVIFGFLLVFQQQRHNARIEEKRDKEDSEREKQYVQSLLSITNRYDATLVAVIEQLGRNAELLREVSQALHRTASALERAKEPHKTRAKRTVFVPPVGREEK